MRLFLTLCKRAILFDQEINGNMLLACFKKFIKKFQINVKKQIFGEKKNFCTVFPQIIKKKIHKDLNKIAQPTMFLRKGRRNVFARLCEISFLTWFSSFGFFVLFSSMVSERLLLAHLN